ncbi:MAG: hypothetical protein M3350_09360 [Actinomycetota bacterium]|nr:hypothetical protein [Actinomycetota bacterium]
MTRNTTTKFVATALAVASLGIAGTAQASEVEQGAGKASQNGQSIAIGEPTPGTTPGQATGQGTGAQPTGATNTTKPQVDPEEVDYNSAAYFKGAEAKQRFERYCNMKDAEPSHSDKKFCEDYRAANSSSTGGKRPDYCKYVNVRYDPDCDKEPGTRPTEPGTDKPDWQPQPHKPDPHTPGYEKHEQTSYGKPQATKGALPFTGLEIWQLGLLGLVLVGGGFGARRLLAS